LLLAGFILYLCAQEYTIDGIEGFVMALGNTYGLLMIIVLLGYGVVEVPRACWRASFTEKVSIVFIIKMTRGPISLTFHLLLILLWYDVFFLLSRSCKGFISALVKSILKYTMPCMPWKTLMRRLVPFVMH